MTTTPTRDPGTGGLIASLNGDHHRGALLFYLFIVLAHWLEHLAQAAQIWLLGWERPDAGGVLGLFFPWLVDSEWLHYGYAIVMLAGFWVLRSGMVGRARTWWMAAFFIQVWHHFEHLILLLQKLSGVYIAGMSKQTSVIELISPRVELHLFYNAIVFLPMVVAMYFHLRPPDHEAQQMSCNCARELVSSRDR